MKDAKQVEDLAQALSQWGLSNIDVIDISIKSTFADFIVLCTSKSSDHGKECSDLLQEYMTKLEKPCVDRDGYVNGSWIVLDYDDIVVHIFTKEMRARYNIEKLWKGSKLLLSIKQKK